MKVLLQIREVKTRTVRPREGQPFDVQEVVCESQDPLELITLELSRDQSSLSDVFEQMKGEEVVVPVSLSVRPGQGRAFTSWYVQGAPRKVAASGPQAAKTGTTG